MKKIALISSFCDSEDKIKVLSKNIDIVKSFGIDIMLISPFFLDREIQEKCDYFFLTKDNPVHEWPKKGIYFWYEIQVGSQTYRLNRTVSDYGWAALFQVKQLSEIAITLDYDYFFHMIYDLKIDEFLFEHFKNPKSKLIFPSKRGDTFWKVGLHLMIFDKTNLKKIAYLINEESYLSNTKNNAYDWLEKVSDIMNCDINFVPVEDEIFLYDDVDIFNFSSIPELKFFIEKNDETMGNLKIFFYNFQIEDNLVDLKIDNELITIDLISTSLYDLGFNQHNMKNIEIVYRDKKQDLTNSISKIKHNTIEIL